MTKKKIARTKIPAKDEPLFGNGEEAHALVTAAIKDLLDGWTIHRDEPELAASQFLDAVAALREAQEYLAPVAEAAKRARLARLGLVEGGIVPAVCEVAS